MNASTQALVRAATARRLRRMSETLERSARLLRGVLARGEVRQLWDAAQGLLELSKKLEDVS